jgi:hypothetical protein
MDVTTEKDPSIRVLQLHRYWREGTPAVWPYLKKTRFVRDQFYAKLSAGVVSQRSLLLQELL